MIDENIIMFKSGSTQCATFVWIQLLHARPSDTISSRLSSACSASDICASFPRPYFPSFISAECTNLPGGGHIKMYLAIRRRAMCKSSTHDMMSANCRRPRRASFAASLCTSSIYLTCTYCSPRLPSLCPGALITTLCLFVLITAISVYSWTNLELWPCILSLLFYICICILNLRIITRVLFEF